MIEKLEFKNVENDTVKETENINKKEKDKNMFFNVTEVKTAQELTEKIVGPIGRIVEDSNEFCNIRLWTKFLGTFWFGDLESSDLDKIKTVATEIKESVYILSEWQEGMYADGRPFSDAALMEVNE